MTEKERLIELLQVDMSGCDGDWSEELADYLLSKGVIVPPVKVGDAVYEIIETHCCDTDASYCCATYEELVEAECRHHHVDRTIIESPFRISMFDKIGKTVFMSREEAEKALGDMK